MLQIQKLYPTDRDIILDNTITQLARRTYDIFAPHYDLLGLVLQDFGVDTADMRAICMDIVRDGLTQERICVIHSTLGDDDLSGRWRTFVVEAGGWSFVSPDTIESEISELFVYSYDSVGMSLLFLIESLERIHPFADRNRRVCSIAMNLLLLRSHLMPIPWNTSRMMWEDPILAPFSENSQKRHKSIMFTLQDFYLQKISH